MGTTLKKNLLLQFILLLLVAVLLLIALSFGDVKVPFGKILSILTGKITSGLDYKIIFEIRLPRLLLAIAVGGGLSVAGATLQAMILNPLAEPYILGISSGGAFGSIVAMLLGLSFLFLQLFSFAGALLVMFLVFGLSKRFSAFNRNALLLTGVMVGAFFSAIILLMMTFLNNSLRSAFFWLMGNLSMSQAKFAPFVLAASFLLSLLLTLNAQKLNLISLGSEQAKYLGVETEKFYLFLYFTSGLIVSILVSVSGIIGFVGLVVPHVCRILFGYDNKVILPSSFFVGAIFLIVADFISRNIAPPMEIPVGAITAIIGAPAFIYLLRKNFYYN